MTDQSVLTAAAVARLKPKPQRWEIPDGRVGGLYLVIQPSGNKSWVMRYRNPTSKAAVKLTLGTVDVSGKEADQQPKIGGHLTLAGARALAAEVVRQRKQGRDAAEDRREARDDRRNIRTFDAAARQFIEEHAKPNTRRWEETARRLGLQPCDLSLDRDGLAHRWRSRRIDTISADDIFEAVDEARRKAPQGQRYRNGPSEARARHLVSALSVMFGWLLKRRIVKSNPCTGMHRPKAPEARERVLDDNELRWLWSACDAVGQPFGPLVKLLLLTGARREEVAGMTWSELTGTTWTLSGSRTKNKRSHTVPLAPIAVEIIGAMPEIGEAGYIFTTNGKTPVSGFSKIKKRIDAAMLASAHHEADEAGGPVDQMAIPHWELHDLRRTAATGMQRAGADLHIIERALNHVSGSFGGIVGVYQRHRFEAEVKEALRAWSKLLLSLVGSPPDNVVPLHAYKD